MNYLDSLAGEAHSDPVLQRELAAAYEKVGDVRGAPAGAEVSATYPERWRVTQRHSGSAKRSSQRIHANRRLDAISPRSYHKIGHRLLTTPEASKGLEHLRKALALYLELRQEGHANENLTLDLADSHTKLGTALAQQGDQTGALEHYRATLALCEQPAADNPSDQRYRRALWNSHQQSPTCSWSKAIARALSRRVTRC